MENTSAPAPEATPAAPAESQASQNDTPETRETRRSSAADRLKEFLASKSEARKAETAAIRGDAPSAEPAADTAAKVEKTVAKIEKTGATAVEQKEGESDAKYELRLAKQLRELRTEKERASKFERTATEASAKAAQLEKLMEGGKANPLTILEHLGYSFEDLVKGINDDKFKAPEKRLDLPPEIAEKLERLDRAEREREQQAMSARAQAERAQHETQVEAYVKENAADFPLASSMDGFAKVLVEQAYASKTTDIIPLLEKLEAGLVNELTPMLSSESTIKAMVKHKPELRERLIKALGLEAAPKAPPADPKGIGSLSSDGGTPAKKMSKEQRIAEATNRLKAARKG